MWNLFCFLRLTILRMLWPLFASPILYCQESNKPRPCKRSRLQSVAVTLPAAVGIIGPNWKYKSRALNETFHESAPVLQAVQQRIQINTLGGKCCDLLVMSELVIPISIACGLHKHLHFRLSLGTLESDAQVRFVLEFSLFFSLFLLVYSEGSKGSGGQVCRGLSLSWSRSAFSWWYCIDGVVPLHPTACNFSQIRQIASHPVVFELRDLSFQKLGNAIFKVDHAVCRCCIGFMRRSSVVSCRVGYPNPKQAEVQTHPEPPKQRVHRIANENYCKWILPTNIFFY